MEPLALNGGRAELTAIRQAIERFLETAKKPVLLEPGEENIALGAGNLVLDETAQSLTLQAWDDRRNLVRKITSATGQSRGRLELRFERFGKKLGAITLVDLARPRAEQLELRSFRLEFRERFRRLLRRQFPNHKIVELSSETNLEESLSPVYPRALLRSGGSAWAAIGAAAESGNVDGVLSFGLIWLDYLRRRETKLNVRGLAVLLPAGREKTTCLRLRQLDTTVATYRAFVHDSVGFDCELDLSDYGNVDTRLAAPATTMRNPGRVQDGKENRLESLLRANIEQIDATLLSENVYSQAISQAGVERGILDLLAADRDGRLAILELKASEDIHLPLQALDYWIHVRWHLQRGEFARAGYFPGTSLRADVAPRILLVAPALDFHPTNERIVRYFSRDIPVERIGVGSDFDAPLRVLFRM